MKIKDDRKITERKLETKVFENSNRMCTILLGDVLKNYFIFIIKLNIYYIT